VDECKPLAFGQFGRRRTGVGREERGRAVQVDPIKPTLKAPGTERLKLKYEELLSHFGFKFTCAATARSAPPRSARRRAGPERRAASWR